jgi:hypothetical protein
MLCLEEVATLFPFEVVGSGVGAGVLALFICSSMA